MKTKKLREYLNKIIENFNNTPADKCEVTYMRQVGYMGCAIDVLKFIKKMEDDRLFKGIYGETMNTKDKIIHCPYCKSSFLGVASNASLHEKIGRYEVALRIYADSGNWVKLTDEGHALAFSLGWNLASEALEVKDYGD